MYSKSVNHTSLKLKPIFICIILGFQVLSFAQQKNKINVIKKDSVFNANKTDTKSIAFNGPDGPYIINDSILYNITSDNKLVKSSISPNDSIVVITDNKDFNSFTLQLQSNYTIPETVYSLPEKMVVISDIEGNYNAFASFLYTNKVIDENHNWIYNDGHLVLIGDFVDRGKNVTQVLWLIYKLEYQAKQQNGEVHFILGNHEILNFHGDHRYNRGKYIKAAQAISKLEDKKEATKFLYSKNSELGKWLATKNVIEKIGDYIFVHGGLSPELIDYKLSLEDINTIARKRFDGLETIKNKTQKFLYSSKGPFWYRGLVTKRNNYNKITVLQLNTVLDYYDAKKIVIGHTPVEDVSTDFDGKIIRTDVIHGTQMFSIITKGLLIEANQEFVIDAISRKKPLKKEL